MVWGCISSKGAGKLQFIDVKMDAATYKTILADNLFSSASKLNLDSFIFQQDNDPKHCSKLIKNYLSEKKVKLLPWPSQSPDLNPIEHIWSYIKKQFKGFYAKNSNELKGKVTEIWNNLDNDMVSKYCRSFRERALAVYRAKGKHTIY